MGDDEKVELGEMYRWGSYTVKIVSYVEDNSLSLADRPVSFFVGLVVRRDGLKKGKPNCLPSHHGVSHIEEGEIYRFNKSGFSDEYFGDYSGMRGKIEKIERKEVKDD